MLRQDDVDYDLLYMGLSKAQDKYGPHVLLIPS